MALTRQRYRSYQGQARRRFRWLIVVEQEFRVLWQSRLFFILLLLALAQVLLRFLQILVHDTIMQDPNHPLYVALNRVDVLTVNAEVLFDFVRLQSPFVLILLLYAGAGMICNDDRNNLLEVYFAKPLTWWDYLFGKTLTLLVLGLAVTGVPAILLAVAHNIFLPGWETLQASYWWGPLAFVFACALVVPTALVTLAASSLVQSQRFAVIVVFMLVVMSVVFAGLLADQLRDPNYRIVALPLAINRIGRALAGEGFPIIRLHWGWALAYVGVVSTVAFAIVARRVRRAELAP